MHRSRCWRRRRARYLGYGDWDAVRHMTIRDCLLQLLAIRFRHGNSLPLREADGKIVGCGSLDQVAGLFHAFGRHRRMTKRNKTSAISFWLPHALSFRVIIVRDRVHRRVNGRKSVSKVCASGRLRNARSVARNQEWQEVRRGKTANDTFCPSRGRIRPA